MSSFENPDLERNIYGLYPAFVTDNQDPENQGRVKVRLPWAPEEERSPDEYWARLATLMAGDHRGSWFIPDIGDEVLVGFQNGDPRHAFVLGMLWNGQDAPPERMDSDNSIKSLVSGTGIRLTMDDSNEDPKLILSTPGGQKLIFSDKECAITVSDSNDNEIKMDQDGITISSAVKITVQASQIKANADKAAVQAGITRFSGVVQCDTLMTNSIVQSS